MSINSNNPDFANHTISSAIKADYTLPGVKFKLDELNSSVKKIRVIKQAPSVKKHQQQQQQQQRLGASKVGVLKKTAPYN